MKCVGTRRTAQRWMAVIAIVLSACSTDDGGGGPGAGSDATAPGADAVLDPTNLAPIVTLQGPSAEQVFQFGDPIAVVARVSDDRDRPEQLDVTVFSDINEQVGKPTANESGFVSFETGVLSPGNHTLTLTARDSGGRVGEASVAITVNGAPTVGEIAIEPAAPTTADELTAALTTPFADPNRAADALVVTWQWFRDGEDASVSGPRVAAARTSKGEAWRVLATATDPYGKRAQAEATVTIGNTAPTCGLATMLPSSGRTDTTFTCRCADRVDPDAGDAIADRCAFFAGGTKLPSQGCTLPATSTSKGMDITCELEPSDGDGDGPAVVSAMVSVLNSAPTRPVVAIAPTAGTARTAFTCSVVEAPTDADGDGIDIEFTWVVNGYENPGTTSATAVPLDALVSNAEGKPARGGDRVGCRVRAYDGSERSQAADTVMVTLSNTPPEGGVVTIAPLGASENDALTCAAAGGSDVDGDAIVWRYTWEIGGEVVAGVIGPELGPEHVAVGDVVTCVATPFDGFDDGVPQESKNAVVIQNAAPTVPVVEVLAPLGADGPAICYVKTASVDKEPLTEAFYWRVNDGEEFVDGGVLAADQVGNCNVVRCRLAVSDGTTTVSSAVGEIVMPVGSCDDGNPCTAHACLPDGSCGTQPTTGACSDLDPCTEGDSCVLGVCRGDVKSCDDGQQCTADSCDAATGQCVHAPIAGLCDDGNACTLDTCDFSLNGGAGGCRYEPLDNIPCDKDGSGCTVGDRCVAGQCQAGPAFDCEEGQAPNQCLVRECRSTGPSSFVCDNLFYDSSVACEDGFWCTIADHCNGQGQCEPGIPRDCGIGLSTCQEGACDEGADTCRVEDLPDESPCDFDANGCTVGDACRAGLCRQGEEADCSALDDDCNAARCVSEGTHAYQCVADPLAAGAPCEGPDFCVVGMGCDGGGACVGGGPRDCDAELGDQCLTSYCDSAFRACLPEPVTGGTSCDDGDPCSSGDRCTFGLCLATGSICLEERLSVTNTADLPLVMLGLGGGRYLTQWQRVNGPNVYRVTDAHGSRENEERRVGEGALSGFVAPASTRILGAVARPDGRVAMLTTTGEANCPTNQWCGATTDRSVDHELQLVVVDATGAGLGQGVGAVAQGTKASAFHEVYAGAHAAPLAFADGSWAVVFSPQLAGTETNTMSPGLGVWLSPVSVDLARGEPVKLFDLGAGVNVTRLSVSQFPESDDFVVAWVAADGRSILARRHDRFGAPAPGGPRVVAALAPGRAVTALRAAAFRDGGYAVVYEDEGGDGVAVGRVARVFPAILGLADLAWDLDPDGGDLRLGGVAVFADKALVAAWTDAVADGDGSAVMARVFDAGGAPLGDTFVVHAEVAGDQRLPAVAVVGDDAFAVGFVGPAGHVYTRVFKRDGGNQPGRPEIEVAQTPQFDQVAPAAAGDGQGRALVVWESTSTGATISDVYARQFDLDGAPMGAQYRVNATVAGAQRAPATAGHAGRFVVAWTSDGQDGDGLGIFARRLDGDGVAHGLEVQVNGDGAGDQRGPAVAMGAGGAWLAAWVDGASVRARGFDVDELPLGDEATLDAVATVAASPPAVAAVPGQTSYLAAWIGADGAPRLARVAGNGTLDGTPVVHGVSEGASASRGAVTVAAGASGQGLLCWRLASPERVSCQRIATVDGAAVGDVIALTRDRVVAAPHARWLADGAALVAWAARDVDGAGLAVQYARLGADGTTTSARVGGSRHRLGDQTAPVAAVDAGQAFVLAWQSFDQDGDGWGVYLRALDFAP